MRFALAGSIPEPKPLILKYTADAFIDIPTYIDLGYTNFDAIVIGAGGGRGGGYDGADFNTPANKLRGYGGEGGGGGFHRVKGLLASLDDTISILVGQPGANGTDLLTDSTVEYNIATTDGGFGGYSSFNGYSCIASGGNGGKRVYSATLDISLGCDGGDGGLGGISEHGWGGPHGTAGTFADLGPEPGTPGEDGPLFYGPFEYTVGFVTAAGLIGKGGGGGAGGMGLYVTGDTGANRLRATAGGRGSYDPSDESVFGLGGPPGHDPNSNTDEVVPGYASGARVTPLDGTNTVYGKSGQTGVVVLRLTAEE
jgi:hypothetical protein